MGLDLERVVSGSVGHEAEERFPQPSRWTDAGIVDRRHSGDHVVAMRDIKRSTEQRLASLVGQSLFDETKDEIDERRLTDAKFRLNRQFKMSLVLNEDSPELTAKYSLMDDDFFNRKRQQLHRNF